MEPTALKLVMVQGPRKGEIIEFQPRSTIRIGRVVRGNDVTVKDSGISSKHLLIGCESGKWTVQDLDSSNGTALNSSQLPPFTPFDLNDGDTLKLGESTSITVHFDGGGLPSQLKRNPRRKASQSDRVVVGSVAVEPVKVVVKTVIALDDDDDDDEKLEESAAVEVKPRRGRPKKGGRVLDKKSENVGAVAEKPEVTQSRKGNNSLISDKDVENTGNVVEKPEAESVNVRVTRSRTTESVSVRVTRSRKIQNSSILESLGGEYGGIPPRGGRGRRKNVEDILLDNVQVGATEKERVDLASNSQEGAREQERKPEDAEAEAGPSLKKSDDQEKVNDSENLRSEEETVDLEKMTLDQWFDFMEVYLPKRLTQRTEEIIERMRRKAERVHEYMMEQKKAKANIDLPNLK